MDAAGPVTLQGFGNQSTRETLALNNTGEVLVQAGTLHLGNLSQTSHSGGNVVVTPGAVLDWAGGEHDFAIYNEELFGSLYQRGMKPPVDRPRYLPIARQ